MLTRNQKILMAIWIGTPFAVLLALMLLNPAYEGKLFQSVLGNVGIILVLLLQVMNGAILYIGFGNINLIKPSNKRRRIVLTILLPIVTFFVFTLPALWLVLVYPSVVILMQTNTPL